MPPAARSANSLEISVCNQSRIPFGIRTRAVIHPRVLWTVTSLFVRSGATRIPSGPSCESTLRTETQSDASSKLISAPMLRGPAATVLPVPFWNEFVVIEPFQNAAPDVLCVEHRDLKAFLDRVLELLNNKR